MKITTVLLLCVVGGIWGRSFKDASDRARTRTLKGVLKHFKDQPRVTDSESLEFEEATNDEVVINEQELKLLQQKNAVVLVKKTPAPIEVEMMKEIVPEKEVLFEVPDTTLSPAAGDSGDNNNLKSDIYGDDVDDPDYCTEGDVMKVACNTCVCIDRKFSCSKRDCNDRPILSIASGSKRKGGIIKYHTVNKGDGGSSKAVENVSGNSSLSNNLTALFNSTLEEDECIDGRTKPVDCNQCICALGKWACTKRSCIALSLREKASYNGDLFLKTVGTLKEYSNIDEDCMEGDAKAIDCNQCVCHLNSWACSDFTCPSTKAPPTPDTIEEACLKEEDVKSKDCNICSCRRGFWVCSKNDCKKFGNRYFNTISLKHRQSIQNDDA